MNQDTPTIDIKEVKDKNEWEHFLLHHSIPPFLQSWHAAEQSEELGDKTLRLGLYENNKLIGICLIIKIRAKRGNYLYAPYGPVLSTFDKTSLKTLTNYLIVYGKKHTFDFIRLAPYLERNENNFTLFKQLNYRISPIHMLSEELWILDITSSEEELLMQMRKTTRNLIRRAIKENVIISQSKNSDDIEIFTSLMKKTHVRHQFVPYPDKLYYSQLKAFAEDDEAILFIGKHNNKNIASAMVMYYGDSAHYHHGASIQCKIPVAYLLQWEAIKEAKRRGCKEYSFWGITESTDLKHPFYGITLFKKGFGGQLRNLLPCHDLPISNKYYLNYIVETIRRIKRGFGWKRI